MRLDRRFTCILLVGAVASMIGLLNMDSAGGSEAFLEQRQRMVFEQLTGVGRSITNARVLSAMLSVPRHEFVPESLRTSAYEDYPLPIGHGQTISQPFIVAFMSQALEPQPTDRILEVGTGSGYQAAVLASLASQVFTIEILDELALGAESTLKRLNITNVHVRAGDGYAGWPQAAPFDSVIVTCAPEKVPEPLVDQLREGGRMVIPVGPTGSQHLLLLEKKGGKLREQRVLQVRFVPMTGQVIDQPARSRSK